MPSRTTGRVDVTKITQALIRLHRSRGFAQSENVHNKYFYFLSCRVGRSDRVILYQPFLMLTHFTPCRSFTSDKARANSSAACPNALRTYTYSTRSGNASFDPTLAGAIAIMAVEKSWRGNRRAESRNDNFKIAPARLEPSPRPPTRDRFNGDRGVPELPTASSPSTHAARTAWPGSPRHRGP